MPEQRSGEPTEAEPALRIDQRLPASQIGAAAPRLRTGAGGGFTLAAEADGPIAAARSSAPLATLDAILALQSENDPAERRRRGARRGKELLDALDGLKAALLAGRVPEATLARIAADIGRQEPSGDPGLDDVIAHIALRAKVELAKLGRFDAG